MAQPVVLGYLPINLADAFPSPNTYVEANIDLGSSPDRWIAVVALRRGGSQTAASIGAITIGGVTLTEDADVDTAGSFGASRMVAARLSGGSMPSGVQPLRINAENGDLRLTGYVIWGHTGTIPSAVTRYGAFSASISSGAQAATANDYLIGIQYNDASAGSPVISGTSGTTVSDGDLAPGLYTYSGWCGLSKPGAAPNVTLTASSTVSVIHEGWRWLVEGTAGGGASDLSGGANLDGPSASGTLGTPSQLAGGATLDGPGAAGGMAGPSNLSGGADLEGPAAGGGLQGGVFSSLTTLPFSRNNGFLPVSVANVALAVLTDDANLTRLGGSNGITLGVDGRLVFANGVPVPPGTSVIAVTREPDGKLGARRYVTT